MKIISFITLLLISNSVIAEGIRSHILSKYKHIRDAEVYMLQDVAIYGKDDRKKTTAKYMGMVKCWRDGKKVSNATGVVLDVGADPKGDVITTNEHIVRDMRKGKDEKLKCWFYPMGKNEAIKMINIEWGNFKESGSPEDDWATASLIKNVSIKYSAIKIVADVNNDKTLFEAQSKGGEPKLIAYNRDTNDISYSDNCNVHSHRDSKLTEEWLGILITNCDATGGASGGILYFYGKKIVNSGAIGIYVGPTYDGNLFKSKNDIDGFKYNPQEAVNVVIPFYGNKRLRDSIQNQVNYIRNK